jgi:hypothetical protein
LAVAQDVAGRLRLVERTAAEVVQHLMIIARIRIYSIILKMKREREKI